MDYPMKLRGNLHSIDDPETTTAMSGMARAKMDGASVGSPASRGYYQLHTQPEQKGAERSAGDELTAALCDPSHLVDAFLLTRRVGGCSARTIEVYGRNLSRFVKATRGQPTCCPAEIRHYLADLRVRMKAISVHQHFRTLRTFFSWCVEMGLLPETPMRGIKMKTPKTLPRVPGDKEVQALLKACPDTIEGRRNRILVALLADSGLRISEALRLRLTDINFITLTLSVRGGKGGADSIGYFGTEIAQDLRQWLKTRQGMMPDDYLFVDRHGRPLSRSHGTHILHRLSRRAGLDPKIGPHQLRHYCATSLLRQTGDLELVRRALRHQSLAMALHYSHLATSDVAAKFRRASPLNNLRVGR